MVQVTKNEAELIRKLYPDIYISMTCRNKSKGKRKHRYAPETRGIIDILNKCRK